MSFLGGLGRFKNPRLQSGPFCRWNLLFQKWWVFLNIWAVKKTQVVQDSKGDRYDLIYIYTCIYIYLVHITVQKSGEPVTFPKTNSEFIPWKLTGTQKERIRLATIMAFRGKPLDFQGVHHLEDFIHPRYLAGFPLWTVSFGLWLDQGNPTVGW